MSSNMDWMHEGKRYEFVEKDVPSITLQCVNGCAFREVPDEKCPKTSQGELICDSDNAKVWKEVKILKSPTQEIKAFEEPKAQPVKPVQKHSHYFKDVSHLDSIDVYQVLYLFEVTDPCIQHAVKKLLVTGKRGHKDFAKDVQDSIDTLQRWKEINSKGE